MTLPLAAVALASKATTRNNLFTLFSFLLEVQPVYKKFTQDFTCIHQDS
jgi:hypothetical protein